MGTSISRRYDLVMRRYLNRLAERVNRDAKESRLRRGIGPNVRRYREPFVWCRAPLGIRRLSPLGSTVRRNTSRGTVRFSARNFRLFEWCVLDAFRALER